MSGLYLTALLTVIGCLLLCDYKYKLAFWQDRRATTLTLTAGILFFIIWDTLGINLQIFRVGDSPYLLGLRLYPEFPIEELFFLFVLCYTTLLLYLFFRKAKHV